MWLVRSAALLAHTDAVVCTSALDNLLLNCVISELLRRVCEDLLGIALNDKKTCE